MTRGRSFTTEHRAKLSAAAKARAAREGVPSHGFKGHRHKATARAKIGAAAKARWEAYWDRKQAEENARASEWGVEPEDVRITERRKRNPNPKPRSKVIMDPAMLELAAATRREAEAKAEAARAEDEAFWAQFGEKL
jgi:hypothetical protein